MRPSFPRKLSIWYPGIWWSSAQLNHSSTLAIHTKVHTHPDPSVGIGDRKESVLAQIQVTGTAADQMAASATVHTDSVDNVGGFVDSGILI